MNPQVMIDNCVYSLSDTMQSVLKTVDVPGGDMSHPIQVLGYQRRPTPGTDSTWMRAQFECLPTVARLARDGMFSCCTYTELELEAGKRPNSFPASIIGRLFSGLHFSRVDAAVERSFFFQTELSIHISTAQVIKFCLWLLSIDGVALVDKLATNDRYPEFLLRNLRNVDRYRTLCKGLGQHQFIDAFHLWTAEVNDLSYFLTTDRKFIRAMTQSKTMDLPCPPVSPEEFLEDLGVYARDPFPHPGDCTIDIFGNPL